MLNIEYIYNTFIQPGLVHYLVLAAVLFVIGIYGLFTSRNAIRVLMCVELILNSVNINMVAFANFVDPNVLRGDIFAIFIMAVAATEAAVAFAIVLAIYRNTKTVDMEKFDLLKW